MKIAVMQPYFMPYIGYFQLINHVDQFVIYDDIQFTKKGWINRNRILAQGKDAYISLPLKKASDYLKVGERELADNWDKSQKKLLNQLKANYRKAPNFDDIYPLIEAIFNYDNSNLFDFIFNSLTMTLSHLQITTPIVISSSLDISDELKAQNKLLSICRKLEASDYINPIGGVELYSKQDFGQEGIRLSFLKSQPISYQQFNNEFIPWLSIIDVLMFNSPTTIRDWLDGRYEFI